MCQAKKKNVNFSKEFEYKPSDLRKKFLKLKWYPKVGKGKEEALKISKKCTSRVKIIFFIAHKSI